MNVFEYFTPFLLSRKKKKCGYQSLDLVRRTRSPLIKDHYARGSSIGASGFEMLSGSQDRFNEYNKRFNGAAIISNSSRIEKDSARRPCRSSCRRGKEYERGKRTGAPPHARCPEATRNHSESAGR